MKKAARAMKNVTKGYSEAQVKVRKATSNEAWGPEGSDMAEIAQMTFDSHDFLDVMDMLDRRMNDRGKMWRHVYKALQVFDYCVHSGSENVVRWGKDNLYVIKSLREFQHIDDEGVDQGANIRSKAKDLTALLQDDERLRQERANRSNMQTRINGQQRRNTIGSPADGRSSQRRRNTRREDEDDEMSRAIEASKRQADEDERKRRAAAGETDDDIAKAIKLSKEEEELRQSRMQQQNENSLFDDAWDQPAQPAQPLYQQSQQQVDFWGNPIDLSPQQQQQQSTGYLQNVYSQPTGFLPQQTGYIQPQQSSDGFSNGFNSSNNPYIQSQPQFTQLTGFQQPSSPVQSTMSNNPYAQQQQQQQQPEALQPMPTGSNNPFAQFGTSFNQQQSHQSFSPTLNTLSEQQQQPQFQTSLSPQNTTYSQPQSQKPQSAHQNKLDYLLAQGNPTGQDTFGNTGELRVPAHFNRTGYVNSAGQGLRPSVTGVPAQPNNPFFTGQGSQGGGPGNARPLTQSTTGPAYQPSQYGQSQYGQYGQQNQQGQTGSLIDF